MYKVRSHLVILMLVALQACRTSASIEDNKIPGQPEEEFSLGLPTDEESFNQLSVFFNPAKVSGGGPVGGGTYQFVSSSFPEIDARGFHESVFDGIGDFFPSASDKRESDTYYQSPTLIQRLGLQPMNRFRKRSQPWIEPSLARKKRNTTSNNSTLGPAAKNECKENCEGRLEKREVSKERDVGRKNDVLHKEQVLRGDAEDVLGKRSGARYVRGMEMGSSGFHGDAFGEFGDFTTMRKRAPQSMGFHADAFTHGFGDFDTMKRVTRNDKYMYQFGKNNDDPSDAKIFFRNIPEVGMSNMIDILQSAMKRKPEMTSMGFHGDAFTRGFGEFEPLKKRRPTTGSMGFHGDTFSQGFGDFNTFKKKSIYDQIEAISDANSDFEKRRGTTGSMGFHGDTFSQGFGDFNTFKKKSLNDQIETIPGGNVEKRRGTSGSMGFHGDTFSQGFGDFNTFKKKSFYDQIETIPDANGNVEKRRGSSGSMGFHGDTFSHGFGDFDTFKKRRPGTGSMGFHGDTFNQGFGDFDTYKKKRSDLDFMGVSADIFPKMAGEEDSSKRKKPTAGSMGFHGDTFSQGFGEFNTYKKRADQENMLQVDVDDLKRCIAELGRLEKRRPAQAMGFHGDTFSQGFGDFNTYKKRADWQNFFDVNVDDLKRCIAELGRLEKRRPAQAMGFHGDTFSLGFGDFNTYKKRLTKGFDAFKKRCLGNAKEGEKDC